MKKSVFVFVLMFFSAGLFAQVVQGIIVDSNTGDFIKGVRVSAKKGDKSFGSVTNDKGDFIFEYKGEFPIILEFYHRDYKSETLEVKDLETEINVSLDILDSKDSASVEEEIFHFSTVEHKPVFPGCEDEENEEDRFSCFQSGVVQVIQENFTYPEKAKKKKIQGQVYVDFVISKKGKIKDVHVIKSVNELLDDEAVRIIKLLPDMKPAYQRGKPVNMKYTVPFNFKLK